MNNARNVLPHGRLAHPSGVTAAPCIFGGSINLAWTLNATGIITLSIYRATDGGAYSLLTDSISTGSTSYTDSTIVEGHDYSYQLQATFSGGTGSFSDPAEASADPIQNLTPVPDTSTTGVTLNWFNFSPFASAIEVDVSTDGTTFTALTTTLDGSSSTYDATGLTANSVYYFRLKITDDAGTTTSGIVCTSTLPDAPTDLAVLPVAPEQVDLTWTNPGASSQQFFIERSDDGGSTFPVIAVTAPGATTYADSTLADGTAYEYRVASVAVDGMDGNPTAAAAVPLAAPGQLTASPFRQNQIDLSWNEISLTTTGYTVERSTDGTTFSTLATIDDGGDTEYADTTASAGTQYFYRVDATDASSTTAYSNIATAATAADISISGDSTVYEGSTYTLTKTNPFATGEVDPTHGWTVDWGDGNSSMSTGDPGSFTHVYTTTGFYTITASTADGTFIGTKAVEAEYDYDETAADRLAVTAPDGSSTIPNPTAGSSFSIKAVYTDPAGHHVNEWVVSWGDGTVDTVAADGTTEGDTQTFTHSIPSGDTDGYANLIEVTAVTSENFYQVSQYVYVQGNTSWASDGLTLGSGGATLYEGTSSVQITAAGDAAEGDDFTVNWGDGSSETSYTSADPTNQSPGHVYATTGNYIVKVTDTTTGAVGHLYVPISGVSPTTSSVSDQTASGGAALSGTASFGLTSGAPALATVDFGNGTGPQVATVSGSSVNLSSINAPTVPGSFTTSIQILNTALQGGFASVAFAVNTNTAPAAIVKEVDFSASNTADFHPVTDDISGASYATAQWLNGVSEPICFSRSGTSNDSAIGGLAYMTATVTLSVTGIASTCYVKANVNGSHTDTLSAIGTLSDGGTIVTATVRSDAALPSVIANTTETIKWSVSNDDTNWVPAGTTVNHAYIVNNSFISGSDSIETVLNVGCANAAGLAAPPAQHPGDASSENTAIVNAIWNGSFKTRVINPVHSGRALTYWRKTVSHGFATSYFTTAGLIAAGDGRCGAWADFFVDVLRAQDVDATVVRVTVDPDYFGARFPIVPELALRGSILTPAGIVVKTKVAQGGTASTDFFANHAVVELGLGSSIGGDPANDTNHPVYDPSYGTVFASPKAWEASIKAVRYEMNFYPFPATADYDFSLPVDFQGPVLDYERI